MVNPCLAGVMLASLTARTFVTVESHELRFLRRRRHGGGPRRATGAGSTLTVPASLSARHVDCLGSADEHVQLGAGGRARERAAVDAHGAARRGVEGSALGRCPTLVRGCLPLAFPEVDCPPRIGLSRSIYVAPTREQALEDAEPGVRSHAQMMAQRPVAAPICRWSTSSMCRTCTSERLTT